MKKNNSPGIQRVDLADERTFIYHAYKENQLYRFNEPGPGIFIVESPAVVERALCGGYEPESFLIEEEQMTAQVMDMVSGYDVPVYVCSYENLKKLVGYHMTRGFLCAMKRKPASDPQRVCAGKRRVVVLENIMNPTNTGAIIRSAAALGIEAVLLTKGCADPLQRRSSRVSMGNVFAIPWAYMDTYLTDMDLLRSLGFRTISMALSEDALDIDRVSLDEDEPVAIIMGTEGDGIHRDTLDKSDMVVKIPMSNGVDSLNVAAASAVAFWELSKTK